MYHVCFATLSLSVAFRHPARTGMIAFTNEPRITEDIELFLRDIRLIVYARERNGLS